MTPRFCRPGLLWLSPALVLVNLILFFLVMSFFISASGQSPGTLTKDLRVGDSLPASTHSYLTHYGGQPNEGKIILLDFWATWCSPCIAMIPKVQALQEEFARDIAIIPVTYQSEAEVNSFLARLKRQKGYSIQVSMIVKDSLLHSLFAHTSLPHYVWISPKGKVLAITDHSEVNATTIQRLLQQETLTLKEKRDEPKVAYQKQKPFVFEENGAKVSNLLYHSLATGYVPGLSGGISFQAEDSLKGPRITCRNIDIKTLYKWAYGERKDFFHRNRIEVSVRDSLPLLFQIDDFKTWMKSHTYGYELQLLKGASEAQLFATMREDLKRLFPYKVSLQIKPRRCYVLSQTSSSQKFKSKGGTSKVAFDCFDGQGIWLANDSFSKLLSNLNGYYQQNSRLPFTDGTNYQGKVDLKLQCSLSSLDDLNKALADYDLAFEEKEVLVSVLVIEDKP